MENKEFEIENGVLTNYTGPGGDVVVPAGVEKIGSGVFWNHTELTSVTLPEGLTQIRERTFWKCSGLLEISIPKTVTRIGDSAFESCTSLTNLTLPKGLTQIGGSAFKSCTSLTNLTLPEGLTQLGYSVFYGCTNLTNLTLPKGLTQIGELAFWNCTSLTNLTLPEGLTQIGNSAFWGCKGITELVIPETVEDIGEKAFIDTSLRSLHIPAATTHLGGRLFRGPEFESLTIAPENPRYHIADGVVYDGQDALFCLTNWKGPVSLEPGTKKIAWHAFDGCEGVTEITIPETVTSIGTQAFFGCLGLKRLTLPAKLKKISANLANQCTNLEQVDWPQTLESIGKHAFAHTGLKTVTLGGKLKEVGGHAFAYCMNLEQVVVEAGGPDLPMACFEGSPVKQLVLLGDSIRIAPTAFDFAWISLEQVIAERMPLKNLPKGRCKELVLASFCKDYLEGKETPLQEERLKYMKSQRKNLYSLMVEKPEVLQVICQQKYLTNQDIDPLLAECDRQNNVPAKAAVMEYANRQLQPVDPLEQMEKQMAKEERLLQHIEKTGSLPLGELKKVWSYEKQKDGSLMLTSYKGKTGPDVTIPTMIGKDPVTVIGWGTFSPDGKPKAIREARLALQSVTIPEGVTKIAYWSFQGCVNLTTVTLPKSIAKIDDWAFRNCSENLVFRAPKNCYASRWAKRNGFAIELL